MTKINKAILKVNGEIKLPEGVTNIRHGINHLKIPNNCLFTFKAFDNDGQQIKDPGILCEIYYDDELYGLMFSRLKESSSAPLDIKYELIEYEHPILESARDKTLVVMKESDNLFKGHDELPTIKLGDGNVIIGSLFFPGQPIVGVAFSLGGRGEIGETYPDNDFRNTQENNCFLQITATNPESIDVLIEKLEIAKTYFDESTRPPLPDDHPKTDCKEYEGKFE